MIEREKNYRTGSEEERQDFVNLEEEEADEFNREFAQRSRGMSGETGTMVAGGRNGTGIREIAAIMPAPMAAAVPTAASSSLPSPSPSTAALQPPAR